VREELFARVPGARTALEELCGRITTRVMQKLNNLVVGKHRRPADVAAEFLDSAGSRHHRGSSLVNVQLPSSSER
jgi:glycine betaine/choline ABC-type transport system substrate-binding protein